MLTDTTPLSDWPVAHDLAAYRLVPNEPRAAALFVHGFGEHAGRLANAMRTLASRGIATYAYDHRGHGRSPGARAVVKRFDALVRDSLAMRDAARAASPSIPFFLIGDSMGGLLAARSAQTRADGLDGVVLVSPALTVGVREGPIVRRVGSLIGAIAPGFPIAKLDTSALSRSPEIGPAYLADPLTHHGGVPARTAAEMVKAGVAAFAAAPAWTLPLLIVHGTADRICDPAGSERFAAAVSGRGADVTLRMVDGAYHEPFNDPGGDLLLDEVGTWILTRAEGKDVT
jgi:alpha-beta hydrolase superfamily lysophospholipase